MARRPRRRQGGEQLPASAGAALLLAVLLSSAPVWPAPAPVSSSQASSAQASSKQASSKQASGRADISDLRRGLPAGGLPPFALTSFALVLAGGAGLAWSKVAKRSKPSAPAHAESPLGPIHPLSELAAAFRNGALPGDLLCLQGAALLRSHLALRTGVPAPRLTTEELVRSLTGSQLLSDADVTLAGSLLDLCDRVKFAGHNLDQAQAEWLLSALGALLENAGEERHEVS